MFQLRNLAVFVAFCTVVAFANDAVAKPLKAREALTRTDVASGLTYLGSRPSDQSPTESAPDRAFLDGNEVSARNGAATLTTSAGRSLLGDPGWLSARFDERNGHSALAQERPLGLLTGLDDSSFRDVNDAPQVSLNWFVRQVAEASPVARRAYVAPQGSSENDLELGLGLFRSVLGIEMDRELALSVLSHTRSLRQLLASVDVGQVGDLRGSEAVVRGSAIQWVDQEGARSSSSKLSQEDLDRIMSENSDEKIRSFRDFFVKLIIDSKLILLLGISTLSILMISMLVSRWGRN